MGFFKNMGDRLDKGMNAAKAKLSEAGEVASKKASELADDASELAARAGDAVDDVRNKAAETLKTDKKSDLDEGKDLDQTVVDEDVKS